MWYASIAAPPVDTWQQLVFAWQSERGIEIFVDGRPAEAVRRVVTWQTVMTVTDVSVLYLGRAAAVDAFTLKAVFTVRTMFFYDVTWLILTDMPSKCDVISLQRRTLMMMTTIIVD